jgi:hypothetical protein
MRVAALAARAAATLAIRVGATRAALAARAPANAAVRIGAARAALAARASTVALAVGVRATGATLAARASTRAAVGVGAAGAAGPARTAAVAVAVGVRAARAALAARTPAVARTVRVGAALTRHGRAGKRHQETRGHNETQSSNHFLLRFEAPIVGATEADPRARDDVQPSSHFDKGALIAAPSPALRRAVKPPVGSEAPAHSDARTVLAVGEWNSAQARSGDEDLRRQLELKAGRELDVDAQRAQPDQDSD